MILGAYLHFLCLEQNGLRTALVIQGNLKNWFDVSPDNLRRRLKKFRGGRNFRDQLVQHNPFTDEETELQKLSDLAKCVPFVQGRTRRETRSDLCLELFCFFFLTFLLVELISRDFPGGPVVKTSPSNAGGEGLIPGWGAKIPHVSWPKSQNIKIELISRKLFHTCNSIMKQSLL